jgi:hypothetical protein
MIRILGHTKLFAIIALSLGLSAQLAPSVALACEGGGEENLGTLTKVLKKNKAPVGECSFIAEQKNCEIEFKVTGMGEGWTLESRKEEGTEFAHRYTVAKETCTLRLYAAGENCNAEIAVNNKEGGTENKYCWLWGNEAGTLKKIPFCVKLKE